MAKFIPVLRLARATQLGERGWGEEGRGRDGGRERQRKIDNNRERKKDGTQL